MRRPNRYFSQIFSSSRFIVKVGLASTCNHGCGSEFSECGSGFFRTSWGKSCVLGPEHRYVNVLSRSSYFCGLIAAFFMYFYLELLCTKAAFALFIDDVSHFINHHGRLRFSLNLYVSFFCRYVFHGIVVLYIGKKITWYLYLKLARAL